jgi:opacity protein-like surface antigen
VHQVREASGMKTSLLAVVLASAVFSPAQAQRWPQAPEPQQAPPAVTVGAFLELGVQWGAESNGGSSGTGTVGMFADFMRHPWRPGLEVRGTTGSGSVSGTLTGPRLSYTARGGSFYVAGLFGPNYYGNSHGVTSEFATGVEVMPPAHPFLGYRVEIATGVFSGVPDSHPTTLTVGVVLRIPR